MKFARIFLFFLVFASPLFAADRFVDVTGWASWIDPNSKGTFDVSNPNDRFDVNFDGKLGYGASVNIFFGDHISAELAVSQARTQISLNSRTRIVGLVPSDIDITPVTGTLQWHFAPHSTIDPYIGAGAAYIVFGNVRSTNDLSLRNVDSGDLGLVVNGGIAIALGPRFAIVGDVKYVPVGSAAKAVLSNGQRTDIDVNPVIASAGLQIRF